MDATVLRAAALAMVPFGHWDEADLFEWHPCEDQPACTAMHGDPCACAGVPWPSAAVRAAVTAATSLIRAQVAEEIAQAIEAARGDRCPECLGKPASVRWAVPRYEKVGRCGAGHAWTLRAGDWVGPAEVARAHRGASHSIVRTDETVPSGTIFGMPTRALHESDENFARRCAVLRGVQAMGNTWICGCLRNEADAHRVGCPEYPEGRRG